MCSQRPVKTTTYSYLRQCCKGRGDGSNSYSSEEPSGGFYVMISFRSRKSQDKEDLLEAIIVTRPFGFELSDIVSEDLRSPTAVEAVEE